MRTKLGAKQSVGVLKSSGRTATETTHVTIGRPIAHTYSPRAREPESERATATHAAFPPVRIGGLGPWSKTESANPSPRAAKGADPAARSVNDTARPDLGRAG